MFFILLSPLLLVVVLEELLIGVFERLHEEDFDLGQF